MRMNILKPLTIATTFILLHTTLVIIIFISIEMSNDGQAVLNWMSFLPFIDPIYILGFRIIGESNIMLKVIDFWYKFSPNSQGLNIRPFIIFGIFGGLQWLGIGWIVGIITKKLYQKATKNQ